MAGVAPPQVTLSQNSLLRDLLASLGWRSAAPRRTEVELEGRRFPVVPLARRARTTALVCEAPLGRPLPPYHARRSLGRRIAARFPRSLTIFTDAARSVLVCSWQTRSAGGLLVHHEQGCSGDSPDAVLLGVLRSAVLDLASPRSRPRVQDPAVRQAVLTALLEKVRRAHPATPLPGPGGGEELGQFLQNLIEETRSPDQLRAVWRAVAGHGSAPGLAVLDPRVTDGAWLRDAMTALEPVYRACLERMRIWLDELERTRGAVRPERLRDFRLVLDAADDTRRFSSPSRFVRSSILNGNLFGAGPTAAEVRRARRTLVDRAAGARPNLWVGSFDGGFATAADLLAALADRPGGDRLALCLLEEVEILQLAPFLSADGDRHDPELERRRELLCRRLDDCLPPRSRGRKPDPAPLHSLALCPTVALGGGFDLVRGEER